MIEKKQDQIHNMDFDPAFLMIRGCAAKQLCHIFLCSHETHDFLTPG